MQAKANRLFFIDAMRAWAILMMLQGHFIDGLLDPIFRDSTNMAYKTWLYFRGITAPVFFTVSGFIFTYLLLRSPENGLANPRVKKGIRRGLQLLLIGYALRLNLFGLFKGQLYGGFFLVDVLHCIGLSILAIVGLYVLTAQRKRFWFPTLLLATTLLLFLFEPLYKQWSFNFLPAGLANYFTRANGSVFTIIPWLGYTTLGAAISLLFYRFRNFKYLYPVAIVSSLLLGYGLITQSSAFFLYLGRTWDLSLFTLIQTNNYLFIRLGDVLVVFAVFMLLRRFLNQRTILRIGANTLSIYVIHFIILYGSFTGLGLYKFFHHELSPWVAISGALLFMIACTYLALFDDTHETAIQTAKTSALRFTKLQWLLARKKAQPLLKEQWQRLRLFVSRVFISEKI